MTPAIVGKARGAFISLAGFLIALTSLPLIYGGLILLSLGGSPYYVLAGSSLLVSGALTACRKSMGTWIYLCLYVTTWIWAIGEVGFDFWQLSPRIIAPTVLGVVSLLCLAALSRGREKAEPLSPGSRESAALQPSRRNTRVFAFFGAFTLILFLVGFGWSALRPHGAVYHDGNGVSRSLPPSPDGDDWTAYGRTNEGRRFAPFTQITKANVDRLEIAWQTHSGDLIAGFETDENTPLQIGDKLITCSPHNIVHALDVDTGKILWTLDPKATSIVPKCRSVGYFHDVLEHSGTASARGQVHTNKFCHERIIITTVDARLLAVDLQSGHTCPDFGRGGTVDLNQGLGDVGTDYYFATSAPTIASDLIIIGGLVMDSVAVDMPSGVVRAFDVHTGKLRWFWDLGQTKNQNALPAGDHIYTRGTPNVWAPISVDEARGLVFLPTGNPAPDHWGGLRTSQAEKYGSSVVALDLATGKERWHFQTTHHDLWDYDVPSQPTLYNIPDGKGGRIPALIQPTKRGEIFVLDRRTGQPITAVQERPVPVDAAPGERPARTQPYSVGMPTISGGKLNEKDMWGFSPLDQLWCRIEFRKLRYDGDFTLPGTTASLLYPGVVGGMNWGSASIDEVNDYLIVNDIRLPQKLALVSRGEADKLGQKVLERFGGKNIDPMHGGLMMQKGTPFAALYFHFMSPLGVPCNAPPYGTLTAIDLKTKKIAWQVPMGTTQDTGPLGTAMRLPMPIGLPTIGGSLVTRSGLIFFAGTQDFYLRAIDSSTGREVWKGRMPLGAGATPMTYISPRTGKQYVVISASGSRDSPVKGDRIIAFALPNRGNEKR